MPKNILITGTSSGIGLGAAVELARRGERVFASMRDLSRSSELRAAAAAVGADLHLVELDVTDSVSVRRAVEEVVAAAGCIDVLVNNAGIALAGPLEFSTEEDAHLIFETNLFGPLRLIREVLPGMRKQGGGRIVNVSSGAAHPRMGHRMTGLYSASKAALSALTEELLKEVAALGIEVVLIEGAALGNTNMTQGLPRQADAQVAEKSPYQLLEKVFRVDWGPAPPESEGWLAFASNNLARACTAPNPPFIFPPELQGWLEPASRLSDEAFVRLCKLDQSPDLYDDVAPFWMANLAVGQATPSAAPPAV